MEHKNKGIFSSGGCWCEKTRKGQGRSKLGLLGDVWRPLLHVEGHIRYREHSRWANPPLAVSRARCNLCHSTNIPNGLRDMSPHSLWGPEFSPKTTLPLAACSSHWSHPIPSSIRVWPSRVHPGPGFDLMVVRMRNHIEANGATGISGSWIRPRALTSSKNRMSRI